MTLGVSTNAECITTRDLSLTGSAAATFTEAASVRTREQQQQQKVLHGSLLVGRATRRVNNAILEPLFRRNFPTDLSSRC